MSMHSNRVKTQTCEYSYRPLLVMLLVASLISFFYYVAYDLGVLNRIIQADATYISGLILTLFVLLMCHSLWRSWVISRQANMYYNLAKRVKFTGLRLRTFPDNVSYAQDFLLSRAKQTDLSNEPVINDSTIAAQVLSERIRGPNQVGWFAVGVMIKFGLLGTVIGFAIMLSSVSSLDALDINDIKTLMQKMTQGMRVAMNTTIVGLVSSMLLGLQYLILDRFADGLIVGILGEPSDNKQRLSIAVE